MSHSHMVIFQTADGNPVYRPFAAIDDAVSFVESIRNEQGVDHAQIFRLDEVVFEFKPYYRVAVEGADAPAPTAERSPATSAAQASPVEEPAPVADVPSSPPAESSAPEVANASGSTPDVAATTPDSGTNTSDASANAPAATAAWDAVESNGTDAAASSGDGTTRRGLFGR